MSIIFDVLWVESSEIWPCERFFIMSALCGLEFRSISNFERVASDLRVSSPKGKYFKVEAAAWNKVQGDTSNCEGKRLQYERLGFSQARCQDSEGNVSFPPSQPQNLFISW